MYGTINIETGLDTRDLATSDSYWSKYVTTSFDYFAELGPLVNLAYGEGTADIGDPGVRGNVQKLREGVESLECMERAKLGSWMGDHELWVDAAGGPKWAALSGDAFHQSVATWLTTPSGKRWEDLVFLTPEGKVRGASDLVQMERLTTTSGDKVGVPCMQKIREVLDSFDSSLLKPAPG